MENREKIMKWVTFWLDRIDVQKIKIEGVDILDEHDRFDLEFPTRDK